MTPIRAIVPAAGKGSRLQKVSGDMPKAMVSVGEKPMLDFVLENISFIDEKDKIGVVGVNGAGKTTFFKIVMGLVEPDSGKVIFENNARVSWLPQVLDDEVSEIDTTVFNFLKNATPSRFLLFPSLFGVHSP